MSKPHRRGCAKSFAALRALLAADLWRYAGRTGLKPFLRHFLLTPGYKCTVAMRTCGYLKTKPAMALGLYPLSKLYLLHVRYKYGIAIPEYTRIGPGFMINRFSGVFINGDVEIGANVNLTHGTVLGQLNRGPRAGCPVIGDRVFFGSGAKVIGRIMIGNDASIGANAVVTKDVPDFGRRRRRTRQDPVGRRIARLHQPASARLADGKVPRLLHRIGVKAASRPPRSPPPCPWRCAACPAPPSTHR